MALWGVATLALPACVRATTTPRAQALATTGPRPDSEPPRYSEHDLRIEPPRVIDDDVVRFPDELWPISDAVAALLGRPGFGGYHVLPEEPIRALLRDAQVGRLPGVAATCTAAPPPALLVDHLYQGTSVAHVGVDCRPKAGRDACTVEVELELPRPTKDKPQATALGPRFAGTLPKGESPARWAERLLATGLSPEPPPEARGGLGISGLASAADQKKPRPRLLLHDVRQSRGWRSPVSLDTFSPVNGAVLACMTQPDLPLWRDWWAESYLIEVDATGALSRCEFDVVDHLPVPAFGCVCEALRKLSFGAGPAGRRAAFDLNALVDPPRGAPRDRLYRSAYLRDRRASDRSAILGTREVDEQALARCLWPITMALPDTEVLVRFEVGADGRSTRVEPRWPPAVPVPARACLEATLRAARFNCPLTGAAVVDATLLMAIQAR